MTPFLRFILNAPKCEPVVNQSSFAMVPAAAKALNGASTDALLRLTNEVAAKPLRKSLLFIMMSY